MEPNTKSIATSGMSKLTYIDGIWAAITDKR